MSPSIYLNQVFWLKLGIFRANSLFSEFSHQTGNFRSKYPTLVIFYLKRVFSTLTPYFGIFSRCGIFDLGNQYRSFRSKWEIFDINTLFSRFSPYVTFFDLFTPFLIFSPKVVHLQPKHPTFGIFAYNNLLSTQPSYS